MDQSKKTLPKKISLQNGMQVDVEDLPEPDFPNGQKFWDNDNQRARAHYYMNKHKLDKEDEKVRLTVRTMLRMKEKEEEKKKEKLALFEKKLEKVEKSGNIDSIKISKTQQFMREILEDGIDQALKNGPLPPPTGYNSKTGTWWDNPADLRNRKRIDYYLDEQGKKKKLPIFENDIDWIEFFLGDPITGGTLLRPKGVEQSEIKRLKKINKLGRLYPIQKEMSLFLDDHPWSKFEVWRGAGKTVVVLGKILRKICDNPNECFFFQSETESKTEQRIRVLKEELTTNQRLIAFYGYLPADSESTGKKGKKLGKMHRGQFNVGAITLKREYSGIEPTVMGISWNTGKGVGYHFTGGVLDDPWSGHNQNRQGDFEKFWRWWGEFYGSLEFAQFCWVLCTKKGIDDIYTKMDEGINGHPMFSNFTEKLVLEWPEEYKPVLDDTNRIVSYNIINKNQKTKYVRDDCFGKYTIEKCLKKVDDIGKEMFEREYQNNPRRLKGKLFDWDKIQIAELESDDRYARMPFHNDTFRYFQGIIVYDPAFGMTESASYNALVAMAVFERRIYILKIWKGHWEKQDRINAFNEARKLYPRFPFYCEEVMHQLNVIRDLTNTTGIHLHPFDPKGYGIRYRDLFDNQKNPAKKARIYDGLESVISDRRLYLNKKTPNFHEFEDELKNFPDSLKLDIIDAVSMGCYILDGRYVSTEILDSSYVPHDSFLPKGYTTGNIFKIGGR